MLQTGVTTLNQPDIPISRNLFAMIGINKIGSGDEKSKIINPESGLVSI